MTRHALRIGNRVSAGTNTGNSVKVRWEESTDWGKYDRDQFEALYQGLHGARALLRASLVAAKLAIFAREWSSVRRARVVAPMKLDKATIGKIIALLLLGPLVSVLVARIAGIRPPALLKPFANAVMLTVDGLMLGWMLLALLS